MLLWGALVDMWIVRCPSLNIGLTPTMISGGEKGAGARGRGGGGVGGRKCNSTTPIGVPIYIWSRLAIPPAPPLTECNEI